MDRSAAQLITSSEIQVSQAVARVAQLNLVGPTDRLLRNTDRYRLDLCLSPRSKNARACFSEHWAPRRFEPIGKLFVVPPGEVIQARGDGGSLLTSVICEIQAELVPTHGNFRWTNRRLEASLDIQNQVLPDLMMRLAHEVRHPGFASSLMVESLTSQLANEIGRFYGEMSEPSVTAGLAPWRLRLIEERLNDGVVAPSLYELASICKLSVRQLSRAFRVSRDCSLGDYVETRQMEHAKRMLLSGKSVKQTALTMGFKTCSNFCFAFRRATGSSPRKYRKSVRGH